MLDTARRIDSALSDVWHCRLDRYAPLCVSDDPYDGGYDLEEEPSPCGDFSEIAKLVGGGRPVVLAFFCYDTRATFSVYFTEVDDNGHTVTVAVEPTFVFHTNDDYPEPGRWFEGWLISLVVGTQAQVCVYGNREVIDKSMALASVLEALRRPRYEALDPMVIVQRLRTGDLLELPDPVFHAISVELMETREIRALIKSRAHAPGLQHKVVPGYHVLSNIF